MDHPLPVLNYDILYLVMALSSTREICSMMETCQLLHREGAKFLLGYVKLKNDRGIQSFTQFMAADPHRRIRYLHGLIFQCGRLSPEAAVLLRVFLAFSAPFLGLRYLELSEPDELLNSDPGLIQAFSRLPYVYHLTVRRPGAFALHLLGQMSGFVRTALLDFECTPPLIGQPEDTNPILAFQSLRHTLVEVSGLLFAAQLTTGRAAGIVFPHVRRLRLKTAVPIDTADYVRAFPNVTSLHFELPYTDAVDEEELAVYRERNRTRLRQQGGWSTLEYVSGSLVALWTLGLECTVDKLSLSWFLMYDSRRAALAVVFEELLRDVRVKNIHLDVWISSSARDALRALSRVCRDVDYLCLLIPFDPQEPLTDIVGMVDALIEFVGCGSLRYLDVTFQCTDVLSLVREEDTGLESTRQSAMEECVRLIEPEILADRIQARAPSLKGISLELWEMGKEPRMLRKGEELQNPYHWDTI